MFRMVCKLMVLCFTNGEQAYVPETYRAFAARLRLFSQGQPITHITSLSLFKMCYLF